MYNEIKYYVFVAVCGLSLVLFTLTMGFMTNHFKAEHPARCYEQGDTIDGYIVEAVVSDTQLYATFPNDDNTVYLLTISADKWNDVSIIDKFSERAIDCFSIVDIEIPNGDKSAPDRFT